MQHLVVLEVVQQHRRGAEQIVGHEHRGPGHPRGRILGDVIQEHLDGQGSLFHDAGQHRPSPFPGGHEHEDAYGDHQREPASPGNLDQIGGPEGKVDDQKEGADGGDPPQGPAPPFVGDDTPEDCGDRHGCGDAHAVGRGQVRGRSEAQYQPDARQRQGPVHLGDVNLPGFGTGRVHDPHAGEVAELHRLPGE